VSCLCWLACKSTRKKIRAANDCIEKRGVDSKQRSDITGGSNFNMKGGGSVGVSTHNNCMGRGTFLIGTWFLYPIREDSQI
jgi:hypothetical protein